MPEFPIYKQNGLRQLEIWKEELRISTLNGASVTERTKQRNKISALEFRLKKRKKNIELDELVSRKETNFVMMLNICKRVLGNHGDHLQTIKHQIQLKYPDYTQYLEQ